MFMNSKVDNDLERVVLRSFFYSVNELGQLDNTISDSKIVKDTQKKIKAALRGVQAKCTCAKLIYCWPCEVCQSSDSELVFLRNFFIVMRNAKKRNMTVLEIQDFIKAIRSQLDYEI